jgi:hypothetical protein
VRAPSYQIATRLFIRIIGVVYLIAFISALSQIRGLIGENGILPVKNIVLKVKTSNSINLFHWPSIFYFDPSDSMLQGICLMGAVASAFIITGLIQKWMLLLNFFLYLSIVHAGQEFFNYQWDSLLLESGFVSFLLASKSLTDRYTLAIVPNAFGIWVARFLLFKLMFQSGLVKILSHDPSWGGLTALQYHFMTQPLPNPLSWYAHHAPANLLKIATAITLAIELVFSWMILIPTRFGPWAAMTFAPMAVLQILIMVTGNFGFFNLLTLSLCLMLVDDDLFHELLPKRIFWTLYIHPYAGDFIQRKSILAPIYLTFSMLLFTFSSLNQIKAPMPDTIKSNYLAIQKAVSRLRLINNYGLFSIMTRTRPEIIIEGSTDGRTWREIKFRYKIGETQKRPPWSFFHMPRLDWQMWFAALTTYENSPWVGAFILRILEDSSDVKLLLDEENEKQTLKYVRAYLYEYSFSSFQLKKNGIWWTRSPLKPYIETTMLNN